MTWNVEGLILSFASFQPELWPNGKKVHLSLFWFYFQRQRVCAKTHTFVNPPNIMPQREPTPQHTLMVPKSSELLLYHSMQKLRLSINFSRKEHFAAKFSNDLQRGRFILQMGRIHNPWLLLMGLETSKMKCSAAIMTLAGGCWLTWSSVWVQICCYLVVYVGSLA